MAATLINGSRVIAGGINYGTAGGSSNAYTLTLTPPLPGLVTGVVVSAKANHTNSGAATLNVNGLGAKTIKKHNDQDLVSGDIENGQIFCCVYDGTNFQLLTHLGNAPSGGGGGGGDVLTSNAGDAWFVPHGIPYFAGALSTVANTMYLQSFQTAASMQFRNFGVYVTTAAGAGTGACGGVYTRASNGDITLIAQTAGAVVATARVFKFAWASGSAVSGGVLTLAAGQNYYIAFGAEGTPQIRSSAESHGSVMLNEFDGGSNFLSKNICNVTSAMSGTGTSIVCPSSVVNASITAVNRNIAMLALVP